MLYIHKRKNQKMKKICYLFISLISCYIIILVLLLLYNMSYKDYYTIADRTEKIKESKQNDTDEYKTIGWIKIQGTNIDTPVLGFDIETTNFPDVKLGNYVWNFDKSETFHNKIDIMGHNILNLSSQPEINLEYFSRFDDLMSFVYYDFAKENKYIQYTVNGKNYLYKIFSVYFENSYIIGTYENGKKSNQEMKELIDRYKTESLYKYSVDVNETDSIISVMTCTKFYGTEKDVKFIVNGRLIRDNEKINNYNVKESKKYEKVKKILEGDSNEDSKA